MSDYAAYFSALQDELGSEYDCRQMDVAQDGSAEIWCVMVYHPPHTIAKYITMFVDLSDCDVSVMASKVANTVRAAYVEH